MSPRLTLSLSREVLAEEEEEVEVDVEIVHHTDVLVHECECAGSRIVNSSTAAWTSSERRDSFFHSG